MLGRVPSNGQSGLKSHTAWMAKSPPPFPLHELHKPKASKGEGVLGGEGQAQGDRGGHTHRDTERHSESERERERERERGIDAKTQTDGEGREGKGRELYLRRRLLRSTGGP